MPSFSQKLEITLHAALNAASERCHEYATLEHLLAALIGDEHAAEMMQGCGVVLDDLKGAVTQYLDTKLDSIKNEGCNDPMPTLGFQHVVQRAILSVQSTGKDQVTGANVLVALFSERKSYAVYFLQQHGITHGSAAYFLSHGATKGSNSPYDCFSEKEIIDLAIAILEYNVDRQYLHKTIRVFDVDKNIINSAMSDARKLQIKIETASISGNISQMAALFGGPIPGLAVLAKRFFDARGMSREYNFQRDTLRWACAVLFYIGYREDPNVIGRNTCLILQEFTSFPTNIGNWWVK